ncbi:hypothetical protein LCGC14_0995960 [marine sediment metagenome]|uniref:Methyltransferase small domain-containing protein n=1 Tax=marine sediment metagenome TaxID=412755 RepID=A0A0F9N4F7_9ZZZZ
MDMKQARGMVGSGEAERPKGDFYPTPSEAVYGLLSKEKFPYGAGNFIWEPACGDGAITNILSARGYPTWSTDLYDWGFGTSGIDFLDCDFEEYFHCDHIITNPPFKLANEFAYRGVDFIRKTCGKLCLLLRLQWLEGQKRGKMFEKIPPQRIWVFSARLPRMHQFGYTGKKTTSTMAFAWFVWDAVDSWKYPQLGWISKEETKNERLG